MLAVLAPGSPRRNAWRFARGEEITASSGQPVRLYRPLDWMVITEHSDGMGLITDILDASPNVTKYEQGRKWSEGYRAGGQEAVAATIDLITQFSQGNVEPELFEQYQPGARRFASIWSDNVKTADAFNDPGTFTALIGFEWTSLDKGNNLHRNVIFRDGANRAGQVVPYTMTPPFGSPDPLDLYKWMQAYEDKTNGAVLAAWPITAICPTASCSRSKHSSPARRLTRSMSSCAASGNRFMKSPQIKGDGEAHPFLSPNDEFADYYNWDKGNLDLTVAKTNDMLAGEYAREALKNGMVLEEKFGTNPYKFGFSGATDSHTGLATFEEDNFFGKHTGYEPSAERLTHPFVKTDQGELFAWQMVSSGLTAVWARENTRESLFDAMQRKETYATTGTRIAVRLFG